MKRRRQRGAVAVMTSVSLIAIFAFTAISVDLGNAWQNKRELVNASDAAALAAAQEYAVLGNGCSSVANLFVTSNKDDAALTECMPSEGAVNGDTSGHVLVTAESTVDYAFAPVIGVDSSDIESTTVARYGIPKSAGGLRPFGLCRDTLFAMTQWQTWNRAAGPSAHASIAYDKANPDDCNSGDPVPGNWATMDFDLGGNSNADIQDWTMNGYPDLVSSTSTIPGDTGAFSPSLATELLTLRSKGTIFPIPIFASATNVGANAQFEIIGFIAVRIIEFDTSGSQAQRSLTLEFHGAVIEGECCDPGGLDTGTRVVQICAVQKDDLSACPVVAGP